MYEIYCADSLASYTVTIARTEVRVPAPATPPDLHVARHVWDALRAEHYRMVSQRP